MIFSAVFLYCQLSEKLFHSSDGLIPTTVMTPSSALWVAQLNFSHDTKEKFGSMAEVAGAAVAELSPHITQRGDQRQDTFSRRVTESRAEK
jgi:hypothetical protein